MTIHGSPGGFDPEAAGVIFEQPFLQAAYRPRDIAKQRELARTSDQLEQQARREFRVFAQVNGLRCIDLGDRRRRRCCRLTAFKSLL